MTHAGRQKAVLTRGLLQTLANYKGEEACSGDVCGVPRTEKFKRCHEGGGAGEPG